MYDSARRTAEALLDKCEALDAELGVEESRIPELILGQMRGFADWYVRRGDATGFVQLLFRLADDIERRPQAVETIQ